MWDRDSVLLQLPHVTRELAKKCEGAGVDTVFDLMDMEDADRVALLGMGPAQLADVARVCNRYPNVEIEYAVEDEDEIASGESVAIVVQLRRETDDDAPAAAAGGAKVPKVHAPRFPKDKEEGWWLVLGDTAANSLLCI